jgi:signal transduction histidine kinase
MGLAIAKEIAEAHGGSVSVESQLGQGTRFTISLPAAASSAAKMEQPA